MLSSTESLTIKVGARSSPLSKKQVDEVLAEIGQHYPQVTFECIFTDTVGDKDRTTSLRTLDKTDFFTREVDQLILSGHCRIGIHSGKDLPDPITKGLRLVAMTAGLDPADVLVMREGDSINTLKRNAIIATSSMRREQIVRKMRSDFLIIDIRGTIGERLSKLDSYEADGVVIAEAALIRLGLTHLNRVRLPGDTVPFQGQLAVLAREDDPEMAAMFTRIDTTNNLNQF